MLINTDKMISMTEANRNFSKVAKMVDEEKSIIIIKNNKPKYVMIEYGEYKSLYEAEDGFRVNDRDVQNIYESRIRNKTTVRISSSKEVRIPDSVIEKLNIGDNEEVAFIEEDERVIIANTALNAFKKLQKAMEGKAEEAGLNSPEDVQKLIKEIRKELWEEFYADND